MNLFAPDPSTLDWSALGVALVGRFAGVTRRDARRMLAARGARIVDEWENGADLVVVGEDDLPPADFVGRIEAVAAAGRPVPRVLAESDLLRFLGLTAQVPGSHLYTPAMLAEILGVTPAVVRSWQRRGLIRPAREVRKLPYFDFHEVRTARHLVEWLASGASPAAIERQLSALRRMLPSVERPLAQLSVLIEGRELLLRKEGGLVEAGGQYRFDFDGLEQAGAAGTAAATSAADGDFGNVVPLANLEGDLAPPRSARSLRTLAAEADEHGHLGDAADLLRAALATGGPDAETCFQLADVLYRAGDLGGARERYFMAVELDEDYVEARANLGCLLAEEGRLDLAIAAFEGALAYHDAYADARYHLARVLDEVGRRDEADRHWRTFLDLVPSGPWSDHARRRLGLAAVVEEE
jgi:tetratricopeptide (TPR) repeat protein